ncbi:MAG: lytic transglycosylase domain-containing protein, partial [Geminicoccaceae bacterium]
RPDLDAGRARPPLLPAGLPAADLARYRALFALQREGRWAEAEALLGTLDDDLLLGHVLAERYLAKQAPRADYAELSGWLELYADLPQAQHIYKLALARKPTGAAKPPAPEGLPASRADRLWDDGLAAWRAADFGLAADRLTRLADDARLDDPERARAAFWAARANLRAQRPRLVVPLLRVAGDTADAFYGPLAQRMLEDVVDYDRAEAREEASLTTLMIHHPGTRRVLALAAIGERELSAAELRHLAARAPSDLLPELTALAQGLDLPTAAPAGKVAARAAPSDRLKLPPTEWEPAGGYQLDRHLLHAVIRAESGFDPLARSPKGALGLMQIMPDTAAHLAKLTEVAYAGEDWLLEPANNLAVGQAWLRQLAGSPAVQGSLIHLLTAYNAGAGRLQGWLADELKPAADDPLLFVESLPIRETRAYVKKVLGSLWAYQDRDRETSPSLRALAENRWPEIDPVPRPKAKVVLHARAD